MTFLLLFGSKSDSEHAQALEESLKPHTCKTHYLSAHRHPDQLLALLKEETNVDAIFAGAGLAAHLPGVVCSKTMIPVFGYPLPGALNGLDALLSILQMPSGLPVGTVGINGSAFFGRFIHSWTQHNSVALVFNDVAEDVEKKLRDKIQIWIDRFEIPIVNAEGADVFTIQFTGPNAEPVHERGINIPAVDSSTQNDPAFALRLFEQMKQGGIWTGINNVKNGIAWSVQLQHSWRQKHLQLLWDLKQGRIR